MNIINSRLLPFKTINTKNQQIFIYIQQNNYTENESTGNTNLEQYKGKQSEIITIYEKEYHYPMSFTAWSILFVELLSWLRFAAEHEELMHSGPFESLVLACDHGRCTLIANVSLAKCLLAIWKS
uniref:Uncharacterized protein n=1 Tax=Meloidogyne enterolobii TaxID=390850 RepID=A0A6V7VUQ3_MELEN|nr:unnamed protein product [Meloidogyne enterolobii]CAD2178677.1 unnamed protein product [Meloidogyne enterolobii]